MIYIPYEVLAMISLVNHLSLYSVITILLNEFPMLYIASL